MGGVLGGPPVGTGFVGEPPVGTGSVHKFQILFFLIVIYIQGRLGG